jgi:integrase
LQQELEHFYRFWTEPVWANRVPSPNKPRTAQDYQDWLRAIFGWLCSHEGKLSEQLSLSLLVPIIELKDVQDQAAAIRQAKKAGKEVKALGSRFIQWLEAPSPQGRGIQSPTTKIMVWSTLAALVKYQYNAQTDTLLQGDSYKDIPLVEGIRSELRNLQLEVEAHESISDEAKWWVDWEEVLSVTEALRQECVSMYSYEEPTRKSGVRRCTRPATAIAGSYQLYILFAMLTYIPPRRIGELQKLKVGRRENPSFDLQHPYLYQEKGVWIIDVPAIACKTGSTYGHQQLKLPNLIFKDGRSFYGDLKEWLDIWRQEYAPQHNFVFSTKYGGPLQRQGPSSLVRTAMHRLTGKSVSPHKFRDICATYFLDREYSDAVINALAEMMAHDPKVLKENYDKRKEWQKARPIEQAAQTVMAPVLNCTIS